MIAPGMAALLLVTTRILSLLNIGVWFFVSGFGFIWEHWKFHE
jgi:hypothetical protein